MEEMIVYTAKEVAERLRVHVTTVYDWIEKGELRAIRIGGTVRITQAELDRKYQSDARG